MSEDTKFMFSAPWWVSANKEEQCYDIYNDLNDRIMSDIESEEEANRIKHLPELYDALEEVIKYTCRYMRYMDTPNGCKPCEFKEECPYTKYSKLLKKVREGK